MSDANKLSTDPNADEAAILKGGSHTMEPGAGTDEGDGMGVNAGSGASDGDLEGPMDALGGVGREDSDEH